MQVEGGCRQDGWCWKKKIRREEKANERITKKSSVFASIFRYILPEHNFMFMKSILCKYV